jgi:hypothetical protein
MSVYHELIVCTHEINHKFHIGSEQCTVHLGTIDASVHGICMLT